MTTFVDRNSTHLGTDRIFTSPTATALYENLLAAAEGRVLGATGLYGWGLVKLNSGTIGSPVATLDIVMTSFTAFAHKVIFFDLLPATDSVTLFGRVSTNGGSTYDAGAGNYSYAFKGNDDAGTDLDNASAGDTQIFLSTNINVGNAATEGISGVIQLFNTTSAAKWPRLSAHTAWTSADGTPRAVHMTVGGVRRAAQDTDAFRLLFSSGNVASGSWVLAGWNN